MRACVRDVAHYVYLRPGTQGRRMHSCFDVVCLCGREEMCHPKTNGPSGTVHVAQSYHVASSEKWLSCLSSAAVCSPGCHRHVWEPGVMHDLHVSPDATSAMTALCVCVCVVAIHLRGV